MTELPILSNLEKRIILVLGEDLTYYNDISRYTLTDIDRILNEYNQKYNNPIRLSPPTFTIKNMHDKGLVDFIFDTFQGRKRKYFLLTELGIQWYHKAREIEQSIFEER